MAELSAKTDEHEIALMHYEKAIDLYQSDVSSPLLSDPKLSVLQTDCVYMDIHARMVAPIFFLVSGLPGSSKALSREGRRDKCEQRPARLQVEPVCRVLLYVCNFLFFHSDGLRVPDITN